MSALFDAVQALGLTSVIAAMRALTYHAMRDPFRR